MDGLLDAWRDGPSLRGGAARFGLTLEGAESVELCLFSPRGQETARLPLRRSGVGFWEAEVEGLAEGQLYGFRLHGPWDPARGLRFNPQKVLCDPWARRIGRDPTWHEALRADNSRGGPDGRDSARFAPLAALVDETALPPTGIRPEIPWEQVVVYEAHPKGFTRLHPDLPRVLRGTWGGIAHASVLRSLRELGVTTLELLPVHHHVDDAFLVERGLANYWGYSTLGYFAPHAGYARDPARGLAEFRDMVRACHEAGIEVLLDVVYNHTCEGGADGPSLFLKGMGPHWYRRDREHPERFEDFTGCGNSLDFREAATRRFVLSSLRFWAAQGVDGFRYDLASVQGRLDGDFDPRAPFFAELAADPVLSRLKHVAEPWDASWGGYGVGKFPAPWREWNDVFRDDVRRFWRGDSGAAPGYARRMAGSPDLYSEATRSVQFAACHDGFPVRDLATWSRKHNQANGEDNRDGSSHEISDNLGHEGERDDPALRARRARRARNLLASALLAPGVPLLLSGDERGRTQGGSNNAYCQDNAISWLDWSDPAPPWPGPTWIAALLRVRSDLLVGASWEVREGAPGVAAVRWKGPAGDGWLLAQAAGPLRSWHLPGRWSRLVDTSLETPAEEVMLVPGPLLLHPDSLLLLRSRPLKSS